MKKIIATISSLAIGFMPVAGYANPAGGVVVEGQASIVQTSADTLTINQASQKSVIDWQSFNIGAGETTEFVQPNSSSISLNRVIGGNESQILGNLKANGQVWLVNPNGVFFAPSSRVDVSGLVASTANISNQNFMVDNLNFDQAGLPTASIVNGGNINIADGGLVALVAPSVVNNGIIVANVGKVSLAAGETFTLDMYGDNLVNLAVTEKTLASSLVENSGRIEASGGRVALTAGQAVEALDNVINMDGIIVATSLDNSNGRVVLASDAGFTKVNGGIDVGGGAGLSGGQVEITGQLVALYENTRINASGEAGGGVVHVGGDVQGLGDTPTAWRTLVTAGAEISADATVNGNGGEVVVWADDLTGFAGNITARGGAVAGDGGFVEISGKDSMIMVGDVDTSAVNGQMGTLLLDPANINITDGGGGANDAEVSDGTVLQADGGGGDFTISENALEALAAGTNISLEATNNITIADLADNNLNLATTGSVIFWADRDSSGAGNFSMNTGDTITTVGADVTINGANITVGAIDTDAGANGNVTFTASTLATMYGDISTNDGNFFVNGATALGGNVTYNSGAGNGAVNFNNSLTGDYTFGIDAGTGALTLINLDVDTLTLTTGGTLSLSGNIITDKALDFTNVDAITLASDVIMKALDGVTNMSITFDANNTINSARTLDITGDIITLFGVGNSTPLTSLTVAANTILDTNADIITTGVQSYSGAADLGGDLTSTDSAINITGNVALSNPVTINTGAGAGDITLGGTVNGASSMILSGGLGAVSVAGAVGNSTALGGFTANGASLSLLGGVTTTGAQSYSPAATVGGSFVTTNSDISFLNAVTLASDTSFNTGAGAGDITFSNTVNGGFDLTLNSGTGTTTLSAAVGGSTAVVDFAATGAIDTLAITASNDITFNDNATVVGNLSAGNNLTASGSMDLTGDATATAGALTFGATTLTGNLSAGSTIATGAVTLGGNSTFTSGGGGTDNITIGGNVTGDYVLNLTAGSGDLSVQGIDVDTLTLTSADDLTINGDITTDKAQDYSGVDDLVLSAATVFTANDGGTATNIVFDSGNSIAAGSNDVTLAGDTLTIYTLTGVNQLTLTANTAVNLNNDVSTDGAITVGAVPIGLGGNLTTTNDDITLGGAITLNSNAIISTGAGIGNISLGSTTDGAYSLTANAGTGNFTSTGNIGGTTALTILDITAANITVADVTTTGAQSYNGAILGSGLLTGGSSVNMTGDVVLGGGVTTSNGDININGTVTLIADSVLQSGGTSADSITINGPVTGDYNLTFAAGVADMSISGNIDINKAIFTSGDDLTLSSGSFTVDEALDFSSIDDIILSGDTVFTANNGGTATDITMGANNSVAGPYNITFNGGAVVLYGIGEAGSPANYPLSLTMNSNSFQLLGAVYTQNQQTYNSLDGLASDLITDNSDITLSADLTLQGDVNISTGSSGGGNVIFGGSVDGAYNLTVDAGTGNVTSSGSFGTITPLASLSLSGQNGFILSNVITTGAQSYTGDVTLNGAITTIGGNITINDTLTLTGNSTVSSGAGSGGDILFADAVEGTFDLDLAAGSGDINFNGTLGGVSRIGDLTINSADDIIFSTGAIVTSFIQTNVTGVTEFGSDPGLDSLGAVTVSAPSYFSGTLAGSNVLLESSGLMEVIVTARNSLIVGGKSSIITGTVNGYGGRQAVLRTGFTSITGGPHTFNGYSLPAIESFTAAQSLNNTGLRDIDSPSSVYANTTALAMASLNPFAAESELVMLDETGSLSNYDLTGVESFGDEEDAGLFSDIEL